jgi:hypothetical protein
MIRTSAHSLQRSAGLECVVSGRRVAIPMTYVEQVIEYPRSPLPLARPGVAGLGVFDGQLLLSLSLPFTEGVRGHGITKGVSLRGMPLALPCALEVDQTFGFVEVSVTDFGSKLATWTRPATDGRGESLWELDVPSLLESLGLPGRP